MRPAMIISYFENEDETNAQGSKGSFMLERGVQLSQLGLMADPDLFCVIQTILDL
jgi:hypothetical protein